MAGTGADAQLKGGDVILAAGPGGEPAVSFRQVEVRAAASPAEGLALKVLRSGDILDVTVPLSNASCLGTGRMLHW